VLVVEVEVEEDTGHQSSAEATTEAAATLAKAIGVKRILTEEVGRAVKIN